MNKNELNRLVAWRLKLLREADETARGVAQTCRHYGLSRNTFYKWKARYKSHDEAGLCDRELGRIPDSVTALAQLTRDSANDKAYEIAVAHAYRGETDEALEWLERAYRQKDFELSYIKSEFPALPIRSDSRYKAFLKKMNLPEWSAE